MKNSHLVHTLEFNDHYFYVRLAIATVAGVAIAGLLTLFMHILIEFSQQELVQGTRANFLDFVRVKRDESSQAKKLKCHTVSHLNENGIKEKRTSARAPTCKFQLT